MDVSPYVKEKVESLPEKAIAGIYEMKKNKKILPALSLLIDSFYQGELAQIFEQKSSDEALPVLHAYSKGIIQGLQFIEQAIEASGELVDKKEEEK